MSDPKDRLFRHLALLRLIPRQPRSISTPALLQKLKDREFDIDLRTLQRDLGGRLSKDFPLHCNEDERPYRWSFPSNMPQFDFPALDTPTALAFAFAENYLEKLLPPSVLHLLEPHFAMANRQLQGLEHNGLAHWANHVRALPNGKILQPAEVDADIWVHVSTALMEKRQLQILYLSRSKGESKNLHIHPVGLVARHSISYLIATVDGYDDLRHFALQRIQHAERLDMPARAHESFDIDSYIASGAFSPRQSETEVELIADVHPQIAWLLRETPLSQQQTLEPLSGSDWLRLRAYVPLDQETLWWIFGLNDNIRVYKPDCWVAEIREKVEKIREMYEGKGRAI
ncbi:helix-turn-helix transcriptional regulator [Pectobacterium punjabense]|uniref:WYL domain-containing protein n=1 Tax=Pectobacterium punjabense TaxID=2108399 RepID=A0ABX6KXR8_9GAMM|nr:WYL domain-containing protein [Pectobacterium punjabense]MBS4431159.1 WYL domain-containing protein [Pectobacterium punjabense]PTA63091.1 WYL domain-containing protein [Pectobacterium punjabense]QJA18883.1 WYL domain-containing protein [Pectobacterium punjabense]